MSLQKFLSTILKSDKSNVTTLSGVWGGKWLITDEKYSQFLDLYYKAIISKKILRFVEKKEDANTVFYMCADIDISKDEIVSYFGSPKLPNDFMNTIVTSFEKVISEFINVQYFNPIISCRLLQPGKCHLNWPGLKVNNAIGKFIRSKVINHLERLDIFKGVELNWSKWIDSNCYGLSGLRMLGSLKVGESDLNDRYHIIKGYSSDNTPIDPIFTLALSDIANTSIKVIGGTEVIELSKSGQIEFNKETKIIAKSPILNGTSDIPPEILKSVQEGFLNSWTVGNYPPDLIEDFSIGNIKKFGETYYMHNKKKIPCMIKGNFHNR